MHGQRNGIFFSTDFHRKFLSLYQMDDKTCVEYHTSPEAKVTLVYALDTGLGRALEYKTEPLKNVYENWYFYQKSRLPCFTGKLCIIIFQRNVMDRPKERQSGYLNE